MVTLRAAVAPDLRFRSTLKPLDVEEVVDVLFHRPLGYVIARLAYPTPVTADQLTLVSMAVGVLGGLASLGAVFSGWPTIAAGGALMIASAVVDCSDGQLARMRKSSSPFGRMLDGAVDMVVQLSMLPGVLLYVWHRHGGPIPGREALPGSMYEAACWTLLAFGACFALAVHTALYDRYKNIYLHHIQERFAEGDDPEDVEDAYQRQRAAGWGVLHWLRFTAYRPYIRDQQSLLRRVDPAVPARYRDMPAYSPENAARYRALHRGLMRAWTFFGLGTHIFVAGVALITDHMDAYILLRLFGYNVALALLVPAQRRASAAFFGAQGAP